MTDERQNIRAWLAEYRSADDLVAAARQIVAAGYRGIETFTPFPVDELEQVMPPPRNRIPLIMLIAALVGGIGGYWLQHWTAVFDYPWLVAGKPMFSWPVFVPVVFELAVLFGAFGGFLGMLWTSGLPQPNHPVFAATDFNLASRDRFFLMLDVAADGVETDRVEDDLSKTGPVHLHVVPEEP